MEHSHQAHRHTAPADGAKKNTTRDLGIMGVLIHIGGDAINNIGVIIAGAIIWKTKSRGRFYADPTVGVAIAIMIFASSIPLGMSSQKHVAYRRTSILTGLDSEEKWHHSPAKRAQRTQSAGCEA